MVASIEGEEFEVTAEEFGSHEDAGDSLAVAESVAATEIRVRDE